MVLKSLGFQMLFVAEHTVLDASGGHQGLKQPAAAESK